MQGRGLKAQGPGFESQVSNVTPSLFVPVPPWMSYSISWGNFGMCKLNHITHLLKHPESFLLFLAKDPNSLPWWARLPGTNLFSYLPSAQRCSFSSQVCFLSNLQTHLLCYHLHTGKTLCLNCFSYISTRWCPLFIQVSAQCSLQGTPFWPSSYGPHSHVMSIPSS